MSNEQVSIKKIREQIAKRICTINPQVLSWEALDAYQRQSWLEEVDFILKIVVSHKTCPECDGSRIANPNDFDQNYEPCEKCGGAGRVPVTLKELLEAVK